MDVQKTISRACVELLKKNPFYGHIITQFPKILTNRIPTLAVGKSDSEGLLINLYINPEYVEKLYQDGKIDGIISVGGLQNTVMAANAMQKLPIGFPKVMATTVASGTRKFELVVGDKDIMVMPAICDFTGMNIVTRQVIANACAACVGMVKSAGHVLKKGDKPVVAVTLMGVTNNGAVAAVEELERVGLEVIGFHATGVGGATMEKMAEEGLVDGILDLTLHELTSEYFGGGFSLRTRFVISFREGFFGAAFFLTGAGAGFFALAAGSVDGRRIAAEKSTAPRT